MEWLATVVCKMLRMWTITALRVNVYGTTMQMLDQNNPHAGEHLAHYDDKVEKLSDTLETAADVDDELMAADADESADMLEPDEPEDGESETGGSGLDGIGLD